MSKASGLMGVALVASIAANVFVYQKYKDSDRIVQTQSAPIDEMVVMRTEGGMLEVSRLSAPEQFGATQFHSLAGIKLGATTTQIRVPAVYHYQIKLATEWKVEIRNGRIFVVAPAVQPSLPVGFDTAKMERLASGQWFFLTGAGELETLQKSISAELANRAVRKSYIDQQREAARRTVQDFVKKWLLTQEKWKSAKDYPVTVMFADEPVESLEKIRPSSAGL